MTKILVDVDDELLAKAAARLGTKTKRDTVGKALEIAAREGVNSESELQAWDVWADELSERLTDIDWHQAWP